MASTNCDVACFYVTKHSWKGKYKRIFSVGTLAITTYNPNSFEITNQWSYSEFVAITPSTKGSGELTINMKKGKKVDTMRFSSEHQRADILTEALRFRHLFANVSNESRKYDVYKHHWSDTRLPVILEVNEASLIQCDPTTHRMFASYDYRDMETVVSISDYPGGFAIKYGGFGRLHLFISDRRDEIIKRVCDNAFNYVGVSVRQKKEPMSLHEFHERRFGKFSDDESLTSLAEFSVQKICVRHTDPMRRILALSETCIIERDPGSYNIATCKPLSDVFAVVRSQENPQLFSIEYVKGQVRTYISTDRDSLLASLIDGVRASGNAGIHVRMVPTCRRHRLGPFTLPVDEDVESMHIRFLQQPPVDWSFNETVQRFNANLPYSGLLHAVTQDGLFSENKEKTIHQALNTLLDKEGDQTLISNEDLENQFHAIRRLAASKAGFAAFTQLPKFRDRFGVKVSKALMRNDQGTTYAAVDTICAFMEPMHLDCDLHQQQLNKSSILSTKPFLESMLDMFVTHVTQGSGALVVAAMLDFLNYALCAPYSETTFGSHFDVLLEMVAARGRSLFKLFQHPSMAIVKGAGLVMKAIIEEGEAEIAAKMQDLALAEGALPCHLHTAMFTNSNDSRMLTNRQLSRHLVGLWVTGHPTAMGLLKRILPPGLLGCLDSTEKVAQKEIDRMHVRDNLKLAQDHCNRTRRNPHLKVLERHVEDVLRHWRSRIGTEKKEDKIRERPIVLRKRRERIKSEANWPLFYWKFNQDHSQANLIWNFKTREELREALEEEIRAFNVDRNLGGNAVISWNHREFEVQYRCLMDEIKIGDYYLRLLLEEEGAVDDTSCIRHSYEFFNDLYHRFLLAQKVIMRCMCLQAMAIVYGRHHEEIGTFNDTKYIVHMLSKCSDRLERDRLIFFINKLILNRRNVNELVEAGGIKVLVELLTLAHLHVSRATVPAQGNVIEASQDMLDSREKEWYYGNVEKERSGPYSFPEMKNLWTDGIINSHTKCWAQGMDCWQPLCAIPQLKWTLVADNSPIVNESDLATLILNMLIKICEYFPSRDIDGAIVRPFPRAKRLLSDPVCLPHTVQLLLTFEPVLVEKVTTLLYVILLDNPRVSQLYLTGMFFFILMYTGSNVVPIGRVLQSTHTKQAFRSDENKCSDIMLRSILGQILPEAMVCCLENYGAEKFSEIFLGEFDTPEVIWNSDMRRMMIQKLAAHVADFTPRLLSNIRALYQYCPIPAISYLQLENELFCNMYYLRHLCDTNRFPNWPIREPIKLLKDVLEAWKKEVEKKPPSMSKDDAFEVLCLEKGVAHEEGVVRKAYFRLAQKHHPDKNPDGREMFEKVNKAYEFLCSRSARTIEGPDPVNIVLILRVQSILFGRYKDATPNESVISQLTNSNVTVLHPYKYAGYPMLIKTIRAETDDEQLFSKAAPLLDAATELAYHTVNCSALNAEELRREHGLQLLRQAFSRCASILSRSSKMDDVAVAVSSNIVRCFGVAALFPSCREKITELPELIRDLCRVLYFKHLPKLCTTAVECVCSFAVDSILQMRLLQAGVLWHVLLFLFNYDFTLEEGGVEKSEESNWQEVANRLAVLSVRACTKLGGYVDSSGSNASPRNEVVQKSLRSMLTPYITKQFSNENPTDLLKILNSNTENPYLVWDNATRAELVEFLEAQQMDMIRTGESDPNFGADFAFSIHKKELIIGEIFVRVYNDQPTFQLENSKGFAIDILEYLDSESEYLHSLMSFVDGTVPNASSNMRVTYVEMTLKALSNVIKNNSGVEIQCIGHFKMLFTFLRLNGFSGIQRLILDVISGVTGNSECINDIAAMDVLPYLLFVSQSLPTGNLTVLEILYSLSSNTHIVKECVSKGAVVYLLDMFCNSTDSRIREKTAELLSKMTADKLVGPKLKLLITKFLPPIFMDAMRDSPEASIHLFQGIQENPELIWNDHVRNKVCEVVRRLKYEHVDAQRISPNAVWKLPDDLTTVYADLHNEIVVGGVFLRLFISNPAWVLRRPKEFLEDLLCTCLDLMSRDRAENEKLEMVTTATVSLFQAQPNIVELVPNLGHIPRMLKAIASSRNGAVHKSCLLIIHQLAHNNLCVQNLAHCDCIHPIKEAMKARTDMVGVACEALYLIFERQHEELVLQALKADLITYLLALLEGGLDNVENPSSTRAQIVKALKSASRSLQYGEQVSNILEKSKIWLEYKDQKHDLFITTTNTSGYLTGAMPGVAGYLMQGTTKSMPCAPPPIGSDELPTP